MILHFFCILRHYVVEVVPSVALGPFIKRSDS